MHPLVEDFFQKCIVNPFKEHEFSEAWSAEVIKQNWRYHTNMILDRGRTDFRKGFNGLTKQDKIILYCFYYMQMHVVSGLHTFRMARKDHNLDFFNNVLFVDFGCGPMTSAVSLAWYKLRVKSKEGDGLRFRYVGVDASKTMLAFAKQISCFGGLFHEKSMFDFLNVSDTPNELPRIIEEHRDACENKELTVVLNCSYFFSSRSLRIGGLTTFVTKIVSDCLPRDKVCMVFQNPDHDGLNENWEQFKKGVRVLKEISRTSDTVLYSDVTGQRSGVAEISLRREYLLNDNWIKQGDIKLI